MTRREIEDLYQIADGIIRSPGEFQGEARYMPHFWTRFMDGGADEDADDSSVVRCTVTFGEVMEFPELKLGQVVRFYEDEKGSIREIRASAAHRRIEVPRHAHQLFFERVQGRMAGQAAKGVAVIVICLLLLYLFEVLFTLSGSRPL